MVYFNPDSGYFTIKFTAIVHLAPIYNLNRLISEIENLKSGNTAPIQQGYCGLSLAFIIIRTVIMIVILANSLINYQTVLPIPVNLILDHKTHLFPVKTIHKNCGYLCG
jgi:hypothetical protein